MKKILMIGTGGTIASEETGDGLKPGISGKDFLNYVPEIHALCSVDCIQLFNIDSTNMMPDCWLQIAQTVREHYDEYDGFVISHGTDTMAYTASALSYLIQESPKPVVLTGSQKPIAADITDSKTNLYDAFTVAADGRIGGVTIVFAGAVILGTRACKTFSKSYGAFSSINYPLLGMVRDGRLICYIAPDNKGPVFYDRLDEKVALIKLIPGASADLLRYTLSMNHAIVIESYGVGGLPSNKGNSFFPYIQEALENGKTIVMTTQVQNEGSDLAVYNVGHRLKTDLNVLEAYDMTTESIVAKLMWALAITNDSKKIHSLFYTAVANDILWNP